MTYKSIPVTASLLAIAALLPAASMAAEPTPGAKAQIALEKEGIGLIRQIEEVSRDAQYESGRLNSFTGTTLASRWTHLHHLDQLKALVNDGLRPALTRLTEIQPQLSMWKQESIDRMLASAQELAADLNSAILAKSRAGTLPTPLNGEYKSLVARIHEHAEALVTTADAAGKFATAQLEAEEAGLSVPRT
jgi:hypothetical protein